MKKLTRNLMAVGLVTGLVSLCSAVPAVAAEGTDDPYDAIADAVPASAEGFIPVDDALTAGASASVDIPRYDTTVHIPANPADGVTLDQNGLGNVVIGLPNADQASDVAISEAGAAYYDNQDLSLTVPLVKDDGSVQITTVIDGPQAPTRYAYPIALPEGGQVVPADDGYYAVLDATGVPTALILPAWAKDANGGAVSTWYELEGNTLVQVVEHDAATNYPVIADPTVKGRLIKSVGLVSNPQGITVSVQPQNSWAIVPKEEYYTEYKLWVNATYQGAKYHDQLICHVDYAPFKTPWNLDSWRPNVGYDATVAAGCNP